MNIIESVTEMQEIADKIRQSGKKIALVPTMGYLHRGHTSLMHTGRENADIVITSVFVNPTQFAPNEDFTSYPRDLDRDEKLAKDNGCDVLFVPKAEEVYPRGYNSAVAVSGVTAKFEGATRPGHFNGVATVVSKLFNITKPHFAIFGQKDYQQTMVVRQFTRDLNFDVKIVVSPTVREDDGLAKSSRNIYLKPDERKQATILFSAMEQARDAINNGETRRKIINAIMHKTLRSVRVLRLDYASAVDADTLGEPEEFAPGQRIVLLLACYIGTTRLIDNSVITLPSNLSERPEKFTENLK